MALLGLSYNPSSPRCSVAAQKLERIQRAGPPGRGRIDDFVGVEVQAAASGAGNFDQQVRRVAGQPGRVRPLRDLDGRLITAKLPSFGITASGSSAPGSVGIRLLTASAPSPLCPCRNRLSIERAVCVSMIVLAVLVSSRAAVLRNNC